MFTDKRISFLTARKLQEFLESEPEGDEVQWRGQFIMLQLPGSEKPVPVQGENINRAINLKGELVPPLEPVAASSFEENEPVAVVESVENIDPASVETALTRIDIQEVREAVQAAVQRIDAGCTSGNSNATGHIINLLNDICGCKKVTDIPSDQYPAVIEGLATLGV